MLEGRVVGVWGCGCRGCVCGQGVATLLIFFKYPRLNGVVDPGRAARTITKTSLVTTLAGT